jgi:hypothetical protein
VSRPFILVFVLTTSRENRESGICIVIRFQFQGKRRHNSRSLRLGRIEYLEIRYLLLQFLLIFLNFVSFLIWFRFMLILIKSLISFCSRLWHERYWKEAKAGDPVFWVTGGSLFSLTRTETRHKNASSSRRGDMIGQRTLKIRTRWDLFIRSRSIGNGAYR